jgi:hypothetical protein
VKAQLSNNPKLKGETGKKNYIKKSNEKKS